MMINKIQNNMAGYSRTMTFGNIQPKEKGQFCAEAIALKELVTGKTDKEVAEIAMDAMRYSGADQVMSIMDGVNGIVFLKQIRNGDNLDLKA